MKYLILFFIIFKTHASVFSFENEALKSVVNEIENILPKQINEQFKNIPIKVLELNKNIDVCAQNIRFGFSTKSYMAVAQELLEIKHCPNRNSKELLKKTLIHELAHFIEFNHKKDPAIRKKIDWCSRLSGQEKALNINECFYLKKVNKYPYSALNEFQNLVFFEKNNLKLRSPDLYEREDLKESFAVNFEYFILDPEYKCRRPNLNRFFEKKFNHHPYQDFECPENYDVFQAPPEQKVNQLDPKRVYRIDYFLASKGEQLMSRFGHSMLRIVLCAPKRDIVDEECLKDINHHLVISFRANQSSGLSTSMIKGVFGGYPSQLYIMPLPKVIDEYTRDEKRDLYSFPLKINDKQKVILLDRIRESFWSYQGDYYFTSNNCASETRDLLSILIPERSSFWFSNKADTPYGLKEQLIKYNLIEDNLRPDFSGITEKVLKGKFEETHFSQSMTYKDYIKTSFNWRRQSFDSIDTIEEAIAIKELEASILAEAKKDLSESISTFALENVESDIFKIYQKIAINVSKSTPWMLAKNTSSYGLPIHGLNTERYIKYAEETALFLNSIDEIVQREKNPKRIKVQEIQDNISLLVKKMIQIKLDH